MLTKEEIETLDKLQDNEYTAEYFFIQLKKDPRYVELLSERAQAERKLIDSNQKLEVKETNDITFDITLEKIKISEIALKSVLNYMSLALIDMSEFDIKKAPNTFTLQNMEQIIDLLTEKFRLFFYPNETIRKQDQARGITSRYIEDMIKPAKSYTYARDRINNKLLNEPIPTDGTPVEVDEKIKKISGVKSILYFDIDGAVEETDMNERDISLSEFDKQIMNAVISLMRAGNVIITLQSIYQVLSHNRKSKLTDNWKEKIETSMSKLHSIRITADFSNTLKYYHELEIKKFKEKTNLLEFKEIEVQHRNGAIGKGYHMLDEPVLYRIAEAKNQIGTISLIGLTNQKTVKSVDVSILYNWLLVRIDGMKHPKEPMSKTITFANMYSCLNKKTKREQRTTRENADLLLTQFKADKLIIDFECVYEKNKITKIDITV